MKKHDEKDYTYMIGFLFFLMTFLNVIFLGVVKIVDNDSIKLEWVFSPIYIAFIIWFIGFIKGGKRNG